MARPQKSDLERLRLAMRTRGPVTGAELASSLGISPPTISRMLARLGDEVVTVGRARATRHALTRNVRQLGSSWDLFEILPSGKARTWGPIRAIHDGFFFAWPDHAPKWMQRIHPVPVFGGLPFFLSDVRPQGFVGRSIARSVADVLRVPPDPTRWTDDDILIYFVTHGNDLPGSFVVGEEMLERALGSWPPGEDSTVAESERSIEYPRWAARTLSGNPAGSSAGGEQPKFACPVRDGAGRHRAVLVKFSPLQSMPAGRRWTDLLHAEAAALALLRSRGIPCAEARIVEGGERCFLEITRFDRTAMGGRCGLISLLTMDAAAGDSNSPTWPDIAQTLENGGIIDESQTRLLQRLWCFGELIGNTDMHPGNVSVSVTDDDTAAVAPVYDMLPMFLAPNQQGEIVDRPFKPRPPLPRNQEDWMTATTWALEYWNSLRNLSSLSDDFRKHASAAFKHVTLLRDRHS